MEITAYHRVFEEPSGGGVAVYSIRSNILESKPTTLISFLDVGIFKLISFKDLDETILQFPNENRPARRYLYFKYLMTFLMTQELGGTKWAEKRAHKGSMWCTPGPYLRKSMLASLAKQVSDGWLPEAIYTGATFSDAAEEPNRPPDNEEVLAMSLGLKLEEEKTDASKRALAADNPDDEADDEEES